MFLPMPVFLCLSEPLAKDLMNDWIDLVKISTFTAHYYLESIKFKIASTANQP